tara:strand:+ start:433 stop:624 length:192 start_codon:yes stop_codon:yes gene_type:complete
MLIPIEAITNITVAIICAILFILILAGKKNTKTKAIGARNKERTNAIRADSNVLSNVLRLSSF